MHALRHLMWPHTTQGPKGIALLQRSIDVYKDGPELAA